MKPIRIIIYALALLVIVGWAVVYFKYKEGGLFHLTLAVAIIAIVVQWLPDIKSSNKLKNTNHKNNRKRSIKER